jgi:hypothetical protein
MGLIGNDDDGRKDKKSDNGISSPDGSILKNLKEFQNLVFDW